MAKGILLPLNAPPEYADRQILWNAVEKAEGQWNAQLARGIIMALPNEIPKDEYEALVRDYCREQFISRGMIADYAIHDKGESRSGLNKAEEHFFELFKEVLFHPPDNFRYADYSPNDTQTVQEWRYIDLGKTTYTERFHRYLRGSVLFSVYVYTL